MSSGLLRVSVTPSNAAGIVAVGDSFVSSSGEYFAGFGGVHSGLDQHGRDSPTGCRRKTWAPEGSDTTCFPMARNPPITFSRSSSRRPAMASCWIEPNWLIGTSTRSPHSNAWQVNVAANQLNYLVAVGDPGQAVGTLTATTGRHRVPPAWALGPQLDRRIGKGQTGASYAATSRPVAGIARTVRRPTPDRPRSPSPRR